MAAEAAAPALPRLVQHSPALVCSSDRRGHYRVFKVWPRTRGKIYQPLAEQPYPGFRGGSGGHFLQHKERGAASA